MVRRQISDWPRARSFTPFISADWGPAHARVRNLRIYTLLKCTKFSFGWGSAPDTAGGAYSAPNLVIKLLPAVLESSRSCPCLEDSMAGSWPWRSCLSSQWLWLRVSVMIAAAWLTLDTWAPFEAVNDYFSSHRQMDALNCARHDTVHRTFKMLMWINMAFDRCATKAL